jgi:hypothetical protein
MSTVSCQSFEVSQVNRVDMPIPRIGNAHDLYLAWFVYERISIDAAATKVSFQSIDRNCYAEYLGRWACNCGGGDQVAKCEHVQLLESAEWQTLVVWSRRPQSAIYRGEIAD